MTEETTSGDDRGKRPLWQWIGIGVILAVLAVGLAYFFVFKDHTGAVPLADPSNVSDSSANDEQAVTYTDAGFSPRILTVKKGTTVSFKNTSSRPMRVASDPHPTHDKYPTKGGCVGSTFDVCNTIAPSQSWSFTFDAVGTWGYHNHVNPREGGTIVVQ